MRPWREALVVGIAALGIIGAVFVLVSRAEQYVYGGSERPLARLFTETGLPLGSQAASVIESVATETATNTSASSIRESEPVQPDREEEDVSYEEYAVAPQEKVSNKTYPEVIGKKFLSADEKDALLSLHNRARRVEGVPALAWASYLEESAQEWANTLATRGCVLSHSESGYGETIYYSRKYGSEQSPRAPSEVMQAFLDEAKFYNDETHACMAGKQCGHYTQIMWSGSERLGCAKSLCLSDEREEVWVCHYDPQGNIEDEHPY